MATIEYKDAVGKISFDAGLSDEGKPIRKTKTYRGIEQGASATNLYNALAQLAQLSALPFIGIEKVETSSIVN